MTNPSVDPLVGRTVAQYEIVSRLGGGGMGVVYRATDHKLDRTVALKFLPPQWSHDEEAKQRFIREAQAASATHHPNICTIHDIETADEGQLFIVMAYYEGPTLKQRLEAGPLPIDEALDIATQIADGLGKAHGQGVVHRDIKPGNLILTEDGVRIVDFGLATFADALQLTTSGSTLGTAAYMSPEQSRGQDADARTDVWAAGVVLYEMLSGHPPFRGAYAEAITYAIRNDAAPPLRAARPEIPEDVEQLVFRALHKDPAIRFQSGRELGRALRLVRGLTLPQDLRTQVVPVAATAAPKARGRRRRGLAAAVLVAALLAGAPAWLLMPVAPVVVAVAPAVNETGYPQLDAFGYALAEELSAALRPSSLVRAVPMNRVREIVHAFRVDGQNVTSRDSMLAIARHGRAQIVIAPRIVVVRDEFQLQVDLIDPASSTITATLIAGTPTSSLLANTAYALTVRVRPLVDEYFARRAGTRATLGYRLRALMPGHDGGSLRFKSLDAAAAFERGLDAYEHLEYSSALRAFTQASAGDASHPLPHAWRSRTLLLMRRDPDAAEAARRTQELVDASTVRGDDRAFIAAVIAEAQGDLETAAAHYAELAESDSSNPALRMELAAFFERRGMYADAIAAYRAIESDEAAGTAPARPELEMCRLYGPTRQNDVARAREHADRAMRRYEALRSSGGKPYPLEAQVLMCRVDFLSDRTGEDITAATRDAIAALAILDTPATPYQRARALYYRALADARARRYAQALEFNLGALKAAQDTTNRSLEALVRMNLGANYTRLGRRREALGHYDASSEQFDRLGEEQRAADAHTNAAGIRVEYGDDPDLGFLLLENAVAVLDRRGSTRSLVFALQVSAAYLRNAGRHGEADQRLNRAITLSREQQFEASLPSLIEDRARSMIELGDYAPARDLILGVMQGLPEAQRAQGDIRLAQVDTRLGDFASARARLAAASAAMAQSTTNTILLETTLGELEYEAGRDRDARRHFQAAAALMDNDLPHPRAVEAFGYLGLLEALLQDPGRGSRTLEKALAQAKSMRRLGLEARFTVFLARAAILARRGDDAVRLLKALPPDDAVRTIGPELRAQVHYWLGRALQAQGDRVGADEENAAARQLVETQQGRVPEGSRAAFASRADIRRVLE